MTDTATCCAEFYEKDWVATLMGESFHPGGLDLTQRLLQSLHLGAGDRVLDIASGTGATALAIAREYGARVVGLELSETNVVRARSRAETERLDVEFQVADARRLPFEDDSFDAVVCECAFSTFEDKTAVAREIRRVMAPGARLGLSDMCLYAPLPPSLAQVAGPWACLQDALDVEGYQRVFLDVGLRATGYEDESDALLAMTLDLKRKLVVMGLGKMAGALTELDLDLDSARTLLDEARDRVRAGQVLYCRLTFSRGRARVHPVASPAAAPASCDPATGCC